MNSAVGIIFIVIVAIFSAIMNLLPVFLIIFVISRLVRKGRQATGSGRPADVVERLVRERQDMMSRGYTASYDNNTPSTSNTTASSASGVGAAPKVEIGSDGRPKPILG